MFAILHARREGRVWVEGGETMRHSFYFSSLKLSAFFSFCLLDRPPKKEFKREKKRQKEKAKRERLTHGASFLHPVHILLPILSHRC
jgi:hypothetical protein